MVPIEAASQTDRAIGVIPAAPWRVKGLSILPDYRLAVTFQDGNSGVADLSAITLARDCGVYGMLRDPNYFKRAGLEMDVVTWPNGADIDPALIYDMRN